MLINKIREKRARLGINQSELAEMVGISQSTLSEIESCKHEPTGTIMLKLALALQCSVEDIFSLDTAK